MMRIALVVSLAIAAQAQVRIDRYQPVPMRDGVKLYADIYRPAADARYPVLVVRTPYGVQRENSGVHDKLPLFARNGYAVVNQDVRGRYESEGRWDPFRSEAQDGYDTIEWAARQPWSNGKVCTEGGSYLGHVQWAAASQAPPHLVCAFPAVAATNIYANWITHGGAFRLSFNYGWGVVRMPNRIMLPQAWHSGKDAPLELQYESILKHLPLATGDLRSANYAVKHYRDWIAHPNYDEYWKAISDEERFDKVKVPVHTSGGWFDIFLAGTINGYVGMRARGGTPQARAQTRMVIGPWGHGPSQKFGDLDFGPQADQQLSGYELRFFDHHLKGAANGLENELPVKIFYMGAANKWKFEKDWPIPGARYEPWYLREGGRLSRESPDAANSATTYRYDPEDPVPTLGGNNCCGTPTEAGPKDQQFLQNRADIARFISDPLPQPLAIAGPVKMLLHAATEGPSTDWMIKLIDVHPDGRAYPMAEGILRANNLKPNESREFTIDLIGTALVFDANHTIRVDVMSSNFPQFDRNPNTGEPFGSGAKVRVARQTIRHSKAEPSRIILPVVPLP